MPPKPALTISSARIVFDKVAPQLGQAVRDRVTRLLQLPSTDQCMRLSDVLAELYPDYPQADALTQFRQLRAKISDGAQEAGIELSLEVDTQKKAAPEQRWCWFTGASPTKAAISEFVAAETQGAENAQRQGAMEITDIQDGKPVVRYFISYAHADNLLKQNLYDRLHTLLANAKDYHFMCWQDGDILPGERWQEQIEKAIAECQFGLLLVSPHFLASKFIKKMELPQFVIDENTGNSTKRAIPVMLKNIPLDGSIDLHGIENIQIFRSDKGNAFSDSRDSRAKDRFAALLFQQIIQVVRRYIAPSQPDPAQKKSTDPRAAITDHQGEYLKASITQCFQPTRGAPTHLEKLEAIEEITSNKPAPVDALSYLQDWAKNPHAQPYCVLLGELGMGKTTTCMAFAQQQQAGHAQDPTVRPTIFIDLRHLGEQAKQGLSLEQLLHTVLRGSWRSINPLTPECAAEIIRMVREERAIVIFDGLDEVLVHLTEHEGQRFTRQLLAILPPALARDGKPQRGRVLLTCRTHYFRTLRDQKTHLTTEDRDGVRAGDFRSLLLLPFTTAQIEAYLHLTLPNEDIARVMATIGSIHNLGELAERPYTLSLIAHEFHRIEKWRAEGRRVTGVMLYQSMVLSWLERDTGKHQLLKQHKPLLMEHFAAAMWRSGQRVWSVDDVEQWLIELLRQRPDLAEHYSGKDRELLKEDLRTATFLVREGEAGFRFAHTSLLEYFLAAHLFRALREQHPEDWALPQPSKESIDFLGQLLLSATEVEREPALATLRTLRDTYRPAASELAFHYALHAYNQGYPAPSQAGVCLDGADLRNIKITGKQESPFNLIASSWRGAHLDGAQFRQVSLDRADFANAGLDRAEFHNCRMRDTHFQGGQLAGTLFRSCLLDRARYYAHCHRTRWLRCQLTEVTGLPESIPAGFISGCEPADWNRLPTSSARLTMYSGTTLTTCALSTDGRLATGGTDGTVRLWDAASGEAIAILTGHRSKVLCCDWSNSCDRLASSGSDGTAFVWDVQGNPTALIGHTGMINDCAWSNDGRLATAGADGTVQVWDSDGRRIAVLTGHEGPVNACAWSAAHCLASASEDGTLRLWDVRTQHSTVLHGHTGPVYTCAWSADGQLASGGKDGTLRVWDSDGAGTTTFTGNKNGVKSLVWSSDGYLVSHSGIGFLCWWDVIRGECHRTIRTPLAETISGIWFDDQIVTLDIFDRLERWDTAGFGTDVLPYLGTARGVGSRLPDGRIVGITTSGTIRVWDDDGTLLDQQHNGNFTGISFENGRVVGYSQNGRFLLWSAGGSRRLKLNMPKLQIASCAWSADDRLASGEKDGTVRLWDSFSGACLATLTGHTGEIHNSDWSRDGHLATASEDGTVRLWDADGTCTAVLDGHTHGARICTWSDNGRLATVDLEGTVRFWNTVTGKCTIEIKGIGREITSCAWSPGGSRLATVSLEGRIRLWDTATGNAIAELAGHQGGATYCEWSVHGLLSGGRDGSIRMWEADTYQEGAVRIQLFDDDTWVSWNPHQQRVLHSGGDPWRYLGWVDSSRGYLERYPYEALATLD